MSTSKLAVLITGANAGLGLEVVKALYASDQAYTIILGGRSPNKVQNAIKQVQSEIAQSKSTMDEVQIDVEDDDSIAKAYEKVSASYSHIDCLINNAGGSFDQAYSKGEISLRESWLKAWSVNVAGAYIVTQTFAPLLIKSASPRLLFLTSGTASLAETEETREGFERLTAAPPKGWPKQAQFDVTAYRSSKVGLNMMMRQWERILRNDGVKVFSISPGFLATNLGGAGSEELKKMGAIAPAEGANFIKDVVQGRRDHDAGKAIRANMVQPW